MSRREPEAPQVNAGLPEGWCAAVWTYVTGWENPRLALRLSLNFKQQWQTLDLLQVINFLKCSIKSNNYFFRVAWSTGCRRHKQAQKIEHWILDIFSLDSVTVMHYTNYIRGQPPFAFVIIMILRIGEKVAMGIFAGYRSPVQVIVPLHCLSRVLLIQYFTGCSKKKKKTYIQKWKKKNVASHFCGLFVIIVFSCDTWDETETWDWGFLVACVNVRKLNSEDKQEVKCKLNLQHWKMRPTEKSQNRKCISSHGHSIGSLWPHIRGLTKSPHSFFLKHSWDRSTSMSASGISMVYQSKSTGILQQLLKTGHSSTDWNILCIWFVSYFVFLC